MYMRNLCLSLFLGVCLCACQEGKRVGDIALDLSNASEEFVYSQIVKSVDYITLSTNKENILTGIKKIYFDNDTVIIHDDHHEGIFIFAPDGKLITQINRKGQAPEEYLSDNAVAVDTHSNQIYVYDLMNGKTNSYNYSGRYLASNKANSFFRDFAAVGSQNFIMVQPNILKAYPNKGIWTYNLETNSTHQFLDYPDDNQPFEFIAPYFVQTPDKVYYYDRNSDDIFQITKDTMQNFCHIDLKQVLPLEVRRAAVAKPTDLDGKAMLYNFCISSDYLLLNYFLFGEESSPYVFALIHRNKNIAPQIFKTFRNDIDDKITSDAKLYYIDDSTWCRLVDYEDEDTQIQLQILHLK